MAGRRGIRMRGSRNHTPVGFCETHGKLWYTDRKRARVVARQHRERKSVYPCSDRPHLWHVGGLAEEVRKGHMTRDEYYHRSA
jgi:hypothetical protein